MKTSPELLQDILHVLGKINSNIEAMSGKSGVGAFKDSATTKEQKRSKTTFAGFDVKDFAQDKTTSDNIKSTAEAIKILSSALTPLSVAITKFGLVPKTFKKSLIDFIQDLLSASSFKGVEATSSAKILAEAIGIISEAIPKLANSIFKFGMLEKLGFVKSTTKGLKDLIKVLMPSRRGEEGFLSVQGVKTAAEAMGIIGDALPKLAKGVLRFGMMQKLGLVTATNVGITTLAGALAFIGSPPRDVFVLAGAAALALVGVALMGFADVIKSIASVIKSLAIFTIAFSTSIFIIVGAIWFASKKFGVGPLKAMLIVVGAIAILAGGFALLGIVSPLMASAGVAIKHIGIGLALLGLGIVAFIGTIALANVITGGIPQTFRVLKQGAIIIGMMTLLFAGIGILDLLGGIVTRGAKASQQMGLAMGALGLGILVLGGVFALLQKMNVNAGEMFWDVSKGVGMLALLFAGIGLMSILIIPGILTLFAMTVSLALFGIAMLEMGAVIKKLGGKEGMTETAQNIAQMVNIITAGVLGGLYKGLGKEAGAELDRGDTVQFRRVRKALKILTGIASALSSFAMGLTAFSKAGQITEVSYDEKTGKPIYGKTIFVSGIAENMVSTFNTFITGLVKGTENLKVKQSRALIKLSKAFVGKGKDGGLIGGIIQFADALKTYAEFGAKGQIFVPEYDQNGHAIMVGGKEKKTAISTTDIVNVIVKTFGDFASKLSAKAPEFAEMGTYGKQMKTFNEALMGSQKGIIGQKKTPGVLSGILEFSNVLNSYAQYGKQNKIPYTDENGKVIAVPVDEVVDNMFNSIDTFLNKLSAKGVNIKGKIEGVNDTIKDLSKILNSFNTLYEEQTSLEKLSNTMEQLAQNFALLVTSTEKLDINKFQKLVDINSKYAKETPYISAPQGTTTSSGGTMIGGTTKIDPADIQKIVDAITTGMQKVQISSNVGGTFKFEFMRGNTEGNLTLGK